MLACTTRKWSIKAFDDIEYRERIPFSVTALARIIYGRRQIKVDTHKYA